MTDIVEQLQARYVLLETRVQAIADMALRLQADNERLRKDVALLEASRKEIIEIDEQRVVEIEEWNGKHQRACLEIERLRAALRMVAHDPKFAEFPWEIAKTVTRALEGK